jgi:flagellar basal-body rod protein FlgB
MEKILYYTAHRHKAIAANIANVETPNYKAIDTPDGEFREALLEAASKPFFQMKDTSNVRVRPSGTLHVSMIESPDKGMLQHNGNNVDIEREMVKMVRNSGLHNTMAQLMGQQFSLMKSVISERITG